MDNRVLSLLSLKSRVAICEEDLQLAHSLELLLKGLGCSSICLDKSFLHLKVRPYFISLLIISLSRPGELSEDSLNRLSESFPKRPILVLHNYPLHKGILEFTANKPFYFMSKPFSKSEFSEKIQEIKKRNTSAGLKCFKNIITSN